MILILLMMTGSVIQGAPAPLTFFFQPEVQKRIDSVFKPSSDSTFTFPAPNLMPLIMQPESNTGIVRKSSADNLEQQSSQQINRVIAPQMQLRPPFMESGYAEALKFPHQSASSNNYPMHFQVPILKSPLPYPKLVPIKNPSPIPMTLAQNPTQSIPMQNVPNIPTPMELVQIPSQPYRQFVQNQMTQNAPGQMVQNFSPWQMEISQPEPYQQQQQPFLMPPPPPQLFYQLQNSIGQPGPQGITIQMTPMIPLQNNENIPRSRNLEPITSTEATATSTTTESVNLIKTTETVSVIKNITSSTTTEIPSTTTTTTGAPIVQAPPVPAPSKIDVQNILNLTSSAPIETPTTPDYPKTVNSAPNPSTENPTTTPITTATTELEITPSTLPVKSNSSSSTFGSTYAAAYSNYKPIVNETAVDQVSKIKKLLKSYSIEFETATGIKSKEEGHLKEVADNRMDSENGAYVPAEGESTGGIVQVKSGEVSWTSPECITFTLTYEADENGYRPKIVESLADDCTQYANQLEGNDLNSAPPDPKGQMKNNQTESTEL